MSRLCALYHVTHAGYYAWQRRGVSARGEQDRILTAQIQEIFEASRGTYGSPRVQRALAAQGRSGSRRLVEPLMRTAGLRARSVRGSRANPGLHQYFGQHPNRVWARRASRPDRIWAGDITYLPVAGQWRYLAVVMDQYSHRLLGWSLGRTRDTQLTRSGLAPGARPPRLSRSVGPAHVRVNACLSR